MPISPPIPPALNAEAMPASQYSNKYSLGFFKLIDHTDFSTNPAGIMNNISAENVNTGNNYGLLYLDHHILFHSLIF